MTLNITQSDAGVSNATVLRGAPAVRISGSRVRFTNRTNASVESDDPAAAGIEILGADTVIVNEANALIAGDRRASDPLAVSGSAGADRIENAGVVVGRTLLGDGADSVFNSGTIGVVDLGAGDDMFVEIGQDETHSAVAGGAGFDRYVLRGDIGFTDAFGIGGFEQLEIEGRVAEMSNFSGFATVRLAAGASAAMRQSQNAGGDLFLAPGSSARLLDGTAFRDVAGSDGADRLDLFNRARVEGTVDLGAGDDVFGYTFDPTGSDTMPFVGGAVNGGAGRDRLELSVQGGRTVDLSRFTGFEILNTGTFTSATSDVRVTGLNGFTAVDADNGGSLTIGATNAPGLTVSAADNARLTIEAGVVIGAIDYPPNGFNFDRGTVTVARDVTSIVTNAGRVQGDVKLTTGRDTYDGQSGTVGGTIFGYAGDDRLTGGAGADRIDGGFGDDVLIGGDGDDVLTGGDGDDVLTGGRGRDSLNGGQGTDTADYARETGTAGVVVNLGTAPLFIFGVTASSVGADQAQDSFGDRDTLAGIENVRTGAGADTIVGNGGNNVLDAGGGNDSVRGGDGNDRILGGDGADYLEGEAGDDELNGGADRDVIFAGAGDDKVFGEGGDDYLVGSAGRDTLIGDDGADEISGGDDDDVIRGGVGSDRLSGDAGSDDIDGGDGADTINGDGGISSFYGRDGADRLNGGAGNDTIYGGGGDDVIDGGDDFDQIFGGAGKDRIDGGAGDDFLAGFGENGYGFDVDADVVLGGEGNDRIFAGYGDTIDGGAGTDTVFIELYSGAAAGVTVDLRKLANNGTVTIAGADITNIEYVGRVSLTQFDDIVIAGLVPGVTGIEVSGWGGNDDLTGTSGVDSIYGGDGDDVLRGGGGKDPRIAPSGDRLFGEAGNDTIYMGDDGALASGGTGDDIIIGGNGNDEVSGDAGNDRLTGGGGNDGLQGGDGNDFFDLSGGGDDTAIGGAGDDGFYFGAALSVADRVDGGAGADQVGLQGDYAGGLTLGAQSLVGIETLVLLSGSDTRFGDVSGALYGYALRTVDANVAARTTLTVNMNTLRSGENVVFDGSAETDGTFLFYGGSGSDVLTGGGGSDAFFFGTGKFNAGDRVDGRGGFDDQIGFQGDFAGANALMLGAGQLTGIETIVLLTGLDARFGGGGRSFSYDLTLNDGNAPAFGSLAVNGNTLRGDETMRVDGSAETNARLTIFAGGGADVLIGGRGADEIRGGGGDDVIRGGGGGDQLFGGAGNDRFVYDALSDSVTTTAERDFIRDFAGGDRIDVSAIDARSGTPENDAFTFIGAGAFSKTAGELRVISDPSYTGSAFRIEADVDGDGFADLAITLTDAARMPIASDFFL